MNGRQLSKWQLFSSGRKSPWRDNERLPDRFKALLVSFAPPDFGWLASLRASLKNVARPTIHWRGSFCRLERLDWPLFWRPGAIHLWWPLNERCLILKELCRRASVLETGARKTGHQKASGTGGRYAPADRWKGWKRRGNNLHFEPELEEPAMDRPIGAVHNGRLIRWSEQEPAELKADPSRRITGPARNSRPSLKLRRRCFASSRVL